MHRSPTCGTGKDAESQWSDRKARNVPLFHEQAEFYSRKFRAVHTPEVAAVFSQLLAIDTDWQLHITPLVGRVEFRRGFSADSAACVARLDVARVECSSGRLVAVDTIEALPVSLFFGQMGPDTVSCNSCHGERSLRSHDDPLFGDLSPLDRDTESHLKARREAFMANAEKLLQQVRSRL